MCSCTGPRLHFHLHGTHCSEVSRPLAAIGAASSSSGPQQSVNLQPPVDLFIHLCVYLPTLCMYVTHRSVFFYLQSFEDFENMTQSIQEVVTLMCSSLIPNPTALVICKFAEPHLWRGQAPVLFLRSSERTCAISISKCCGNLHSNKRRWNKPCRRFRTKCR